jgi:hypothetical protein
MITSPSQAMVRAQREHVAKGWFVPTADRRKLGIAIPAMNKRIISPISSCSRDRALCNFMQLPSFAGWTVGLSCFRCEPPEHGCSFWKDPPVLLEAVFTVEPKRSKDAPRRGTLFPPPIPWVRCSICVLTLSIQHPSACCSLVARRSSGIADFREAFVFWRKGVRPNERIVPLIFHGTSPSTQIKRVGSGQSEIPIFN